MQALGAACGHSVAPKKHWSQLAAEGITTK